MDIKLIVAYLITLIGSLGYIGIFILMLLESLSLPIPTEIVMIPAGYLVYQGKMNLLLVILMGILGSVAGGWIEYILASKFGRGLVLNLFKKRHLKEVEYFFEKYGDASILIGRLTPFIRGYISFAAGIAKMNKIKFTIYSTVGVSIWVVILTFLGYFFGQNKGIIIKYLNEISIAVIVLVVIIFIYHKKFYLKKVFRYD